jgi:prepilin-type N-terminal cleavage/methylation domain-containing protein/prepilin-type processing-associated H-X9-DG protein
MERQSRKQISTPAIRLGGASSDGIIGSFRPSGARSYHLRDGFTLVEILVVLGIVAALAAVGWAVFASVRENARSSTCLSNEHQIALAVTQYAHDADGVFPYQWRVSIVRPFSIIGWHQLVQPYVKSTAVFRCPDDTGSKVFTVLPESFPNFHTSYAANYNIVHPITRQALPMSAVAQPANAVLLTDGGSQTWEGGNPWHSGVSVDSPFKDGCVLLDEPEDDGAIWPPSKSQYACGPRLRHHSMSNVAFVDGHVKVMDAQRWYFQMSPWVRIGTGGT